VRSGRILLLLGSLCCASLCWLAPLSVNAQLPAGSSAGQLPFGPSSAEQGSSLSDPSQAPGAAFLFDLEAKFCKATVEGGGSAFASFFADDAVTLANGKAPVIGRSAIAAEAKWSPKEYQLTWKPDGARMSSAGDMGFTWGHYEGRLIDQNGSEIATSGRYFTVWKRQPDGTWKVELDASNVEPAHSGDCCRLP
jgi:ketosteroid isomerase-like protein